MTDKFEIRPGAPSPLPATGQVWRVANGIIEVYLVSDTGRHLIAIAKDGDVIASLDPGTSLQICLIVGEPSSLCEERAADTFGWTVLIAKQTGMDPASLNTRDLASLDRHFKEQNAKQQAQLLQRIRARSEVDAKPNPIRLSLNRIARHMKVQLDLEDKLRDADVFERLDVYCRTSGLRAMRVALNAGWWRDDRGPLLVRSKKDNAIASLIWTKRGYLDETETPVTAERAAEYREICWRVYAPISYDVSRIRNMVRWVLSSLANEAVFIGVAGAGSAVLGLLVPITTGWLIDEIIPTGAANLLLLVGLALFVAALFSAALSIIRNRAISRVTGRGAPTLDASIADFLLRLPVSFFRTMNAGDINQRVLSLNAIYKLIAKIILDAGLTLILSLVYLILLIFYSLPMAFVAIILTGVYVSAVAISRFSQAKPLRISAEHSSKLASLTYEILDGVAKLRMSAVEDRVVERWSHVYRDEQGERAKAQRIGAHFAAFADSWQIITLIGLFAAAGFLNGGDLTSGELVAFLVAFASFQASFGAFCESLLSIFSAIPLAERARPILTAAPETGAGRKDPGTLRGTIQASGLTFSYGKSVAPLIDGLSFDIAAGEHVAIVGGSGSGKSTILRLLLGFETPTSGSLTYDAQQLTSLDPSRVRSQIGVVLQSSQLFAGSILDNIRGASTATFAQCELAVERAGLRLDIANMPMGLHTQITEGAGTLSGGQRQRILIARAIASEPAILFFDEATSALDNVTQAIVSKTLDSMTATRVTIAHRLSTVKNADRICMLEKGKFIETGRFDDLMALNGAFAKLAQRQLIEAN